jgi:hypothetical protein
MGNSASDLLASFESNFKDISNPSSSNQNKNIIEVKFDNNSPSFNDYFFNESKTNEFNELPIMVFVDEIPKNLQLGGDRKKSKKGLDSLESLGLHDNEIKSINKYTLSEFEDELVDTPQSSEFYPKRVSNLERYEHGTETSEPPKKKTINDDNSDSEDLDDIDEDNLDDSSDHLKPMKHVQKRYIRSSSPNPYSKNVKTLLKKGGFHTDSSINVLPQYQ